MGDVKEFGPHKPRNKKQKPPGDEQTKEEDLTGALAALGDAARQSQRDKLIALALNKQKAEKLKLFRGPDDTAYAAFEHGGHREAWPLRLRGFKRWLSREYHQKYSTDDFKTGASSQAIAEALDTLEAVAVEGEEQAVHQRIAWGADGSIWLDLCDDKWRAVHITAEGWSVHATPTVYFTRRRGMLALPEPERGGSWDTLWRLANLQTSKQRTMAVSWLLGTFRPSGPYPVLATEGEQGSGKSVVCRILRGLVDPNEATSRRPPRDERDLFIAAGNGHVIAYENLSGIPPWLSDALCTLSTGGGYATRTLYENAEETIINAQRPILLNGIDAIATRGDLRDRTLLLTLDQISDTNRKPEADLWAQYETATPQLLGLLLDAVSAALKNWSETKLDRSPRMADFARWIVSAEKGGMLPWEPGEFLSTYRDAQAGMAAQTVESDRLAQAIIAMIAEQSGQTWFGTATALADKLRPYVLDPDPKRDAWLHNPRALGNRLRRVAPDLRTQNVYMDHDTVGHSKTRTHIIANSQDGLDRVRKSLSATSATSASAKKPSSRAENRADNDADNDSVTSAESSITSAGLSAGKTLQQRGSSDFRGQADVADNDLPTLSNTTPDDDSEVVC